MSQTYNVGVGIHAVTDPAVGLPMQGFAVPQFTKSVETDLYARAFLIEDTVTANRVLMICADIWSCSHAVKKAVVERLRKTFGALYTDDNVMICGTHTHSGPGRYIGHKLYDLVPGGFDPFTLECIVAGMVEATKQAHSSLAPGKIYLGTGVVEFCGMNRSLPAYENNPQEERDRYDAATDKEMLLLKFTHVDENQKEAPIGLLNWYAIHPTDRGQKNTAVTGDNKGWASHLFETDMNADRGTPFVAAFATSNAGDVSGNVELGHPPDGVHDKERMEYHGQLLFEAAKGIFNDDNMEELKGELAVRHTRVDMSHHSIDDWEDARTWPPAIGFAFAAGSAEDGVPKPNVGIKEGIPKSKLSVWNFIRRGLGIAVSFFAEGLRGPDVLSEDVVEGHGEKPIFYALQYDDTRLVPTVLPFQVIKLGQLVITAVPGELTTMAGRRIREDILNTFENTDAKHLALAAYANDYCQYVTTPQEYNMQHYEGATTLYGPHTLDSYIQTLTELSEAIIDGDPIEAGPSGPANTSKTIKRWTFRNLSDKPLLLMVYGADADPMNLPSPVEVKAIASRQEVAYNEDEFKVGLCPPMTEIRARFADQDSFRVDINQLVTIQKDGTVEVGTYTPPKR